MRTLPGAVRSGMKAVRRRDVVTIRSGLWALRASYVVHRRLARDGMGRVRLPDPPRLRSDTGRSSLRVIEAVCDKQALTCLESALVRQAWLAAQGQRYEIVLGVTAPSTGFHAHAWLESDPVDPLFQVLGSGDRGQPRDPSS